jgi:ubiquinone/menaquinone biosynthesis C-methylase UbiE
VIDPSIEDHYGTGYEVSRLSPGGQPTLEFVRSLELLEQLLPKPPAQLLDVGGGPGAYAAPLARRGYRVQLIDPLVLHVKQAAEHAYNDPTAKFMVSQGDARELPAKNESCDAVVLFGPLYHLTDKRDRIKALAEAWRVLRPQGRIIAMAISRFASLLDGVYEGWLDNAIYRAIVDQDLLTGQHRNPDPVENPQYFTTAYFHTVDDFASEVGEVGFAGLTIFAVEGPAWPLQEQWLNNPERREQILFAVRAVEREPSLMGFSHHFIAAGTKQ